LITGLSIKTPVEVGFELPPPPPPQLTKIGKIKQKRRVIFMLVLPVINQNIILMLPD
jgi:hypothetical protein